MARYKKEHRDEARAAILDATAKRLRKSGFHGVGVDGLMAEAGLTSGAFYSHFPSKEALFAEVLSLSSDRSIERIRRLREDQGVCWLSGYLDFYFGRPHRDAPETGCCLVALSSDVGRAGEAVRDSYELSVKRLAGEIADGVRGADEEERSRNARALVSLMVGALVLSRALPAGEMSDQILGDAKRVAETFVPSGLA